MRTALRIVLADRDADRSMVITSLLQASGFDLHTVPCGDLVVDTLYQDPPDVIILSQDLCWSSGVPAAELLLHALAGSARWQPCGVIVLGAPLPAVFVQNHQWRALPEPIDLDDLIACLSLYTASGAHR